MAGARRTVGELVLRELRACGLPWALEPRKRHVAVVVAGRVVAVVHHVYQHRRGPDGYKNVVSAIRRRAREIREGGETR